MEGGDPSGPLVALAFKISDDGFRGPLVFVRVYSGTLRPRDTLYCTNLRGPASQLASQPASKGKRAGRAKPPRLRKERVASLLRVYAGSVEEASALRAGDIGAVVGLRHVVTGDTLVRSSEFDAGKGRVRLPGIEVPSTVFLAALEAESATEQVAQKSLAGCARLLVSFAITFIPSTGLHQMIHHFRIQPRNCAPDSHFAL